MPRTLRRATVALACALTCSVLTGCGGDAVEPSAEAARDAGSGPGGSGAVTATTEPTPATDPSPEPVDACAVLDQVDVAGLLGGPEEFRDDPTDRGQEPGRCQVRHNGINVLVSITPAADYLAKTAVLSGTPFDPALGDQSTGVVFQTSGDPTSQLVQVVVAEGEHTVSLGTPDVPAGQASVDQAVALTSAVLDAL